MAIKRLYDTLVGATVRANQLLHGMRQSDTQNGLTFTNTNGALTITGTITEAFSYDYVPFTDTFTKFIRDGRKYLLTLNKAIPYAWGVSGYSTSSESVNTSATMFTNTNGGIWENGLVFRAPVGTTVNITDLRANIIDLTDYFSSASIADYLYSLETATAGAGIAKLREWGFITGEYIPYNAGSLESVEATAHKMVGFNCWNSETDSLRKNIGANGDLVNNNAYATSDYIPVLPNTTYYAKNVGPSANVRTCFLYDSEKNPLSTISIGGASGVSVSGNITTTDKTRYVRLVRFIDQTEFCFSLSSSRNGEYEPYSAHTYDLGTDTLRGLFKLDSENRLYADGDTKTSDGMVTRKYGVVDLGTLDWGYLSSNKLFFTSINGKKPSITEGVVSQYTNGGWWSEWADKDRVWCGNAANNGFVVKDTRFTDAATFKTAMSGVYLVYELATPTTEQSTPFTSPQICDPDGTEEYVTSNGVPVGHETRYQL